MKTLYITAANEGGFVVLDDQTERGYLRAMLFAGTLRECLSFIEAKLSTPPPVATA